MQPPDHSGVLCHHAEYQRTLLLSGTKPRGRAHSSYLTPPTLPACSTETAAGYKNASEATMTLRALAVHKADRLELHGWHAVWVNLSCLRISPRVPSSVPSSSCD